MIYIGATNYYIFIIIPLLLLSVTLFTRFYSRIFLDLKHLEASTRSPILSLLTSTIQGISLIRCHQYESHLISKMNDLINNHGRVYMAMVGADNWFFFRVITLANIFLIFVVFLAIQFRDSLSLSTIALSIVYAVALVKYSFHLTRCVSIPPNSLSSFLFHYIYAF